jgi:thiamine-monophosphate kinase
VDEFEIIRRYFERDTSPPSVVTGIGDDGAVLRPTPDRDLLVVVDTLVADVHFPRTLAAEDIGFRSVAVNLSDIAAMGGRPLWMTLAITMTESDPLWLDGFARGLFLAADQYQVALVGGDTTAGIDTVISVQVTGDIEPGTAMTRSGALAGDKIYVTGFAGDAAAGLAFLQSGEQKGNDVEYLVQRFCRPDARVEFGQAIRMHATAAIDLSDGLFTDIEKLLVASEVSGTVELRAVPVSAQLRGLMQEDDAMRFALGGGDDYELCFTSSVAEDVLQKIARDCNVELSQVGEVAAGAGLNCTNDGAPFEYHHEGYKHFK